MSEKKYINSLIAKIDRLVQGNRDAGTANTLLRHRINCHQSKIEALQSKLKLGEEALEEVDGVMCNLPGWMYEGSEDKNGKVIPSTAKKVTEALAQIKGGK